MMTDIIGVKFKTNGKVYSFAPGEFSPPEGSYVVVDTARGPECGIVASRRHAVPDDSLTSPLKPILRLATPEDLEALERNKQYMADAMRVCEERIAARKLPMRLVDVECGFDSNKLIFYFTAESRVDFRDLVKDLASVFRMRIELRQIGVRDEAKMLGGLGACGRPICCGAFLGDFQPVSIKMAKEQNLSLNPTKISGQCGRLMCCLKYEQDNYEQILKKLPRVGKEIMTPDGIGVVTEIGVIREKVKVRLHQPDDTYDIREFSLDEVCKPGEALPERSEEPSQEEMEQELLPEDDFLAGIPPQYRPQTTTAPAREQKPPRTENKKPEPKPTGKGKERQDKEKAEEKPEQPARRRYPRPKGPKQSAEQYFSNQEKGNNAREGRSEEKPEKSEKPPRRPRNNEARQPEAPKENK